MNVDIKRVGCLESAPVLGPRSFALPRFIRRLVRSVAVFINGLEVAWTVSHLAERYYAMNDLQLERVGLTRDQIPEELVRLFTR